MWENAPKILALAIRKCNNSKADTRTSQWQSNMQAYTEELNDNPYITALHYTFFFWMASRSPLISSFD